jgi:hypothetical protein
MCNFKDEILLSWEDYNNPSNRVRLKGKFCIHGHIYALNYLENIILRLIKCVMRVLLYVI